MGRLFSSNAASDFLQDLLLTVQSQHDYNATQVPPEWHSWLQHIRKDAPVADPIVQSSTPPWQAVRHLFPIWLFMLKDIPTALGRKLDRNSWRIQALQHCCAQDQGLGACS